jgi:hypothetical protein
VRRICPPSSAPAVAWWAVLKRTVREFRADNFVDRDAAPVD